MIHFRTHIIGVLVAAALLQACSPTVDSIKVRDDVAKAQTDGQKLIVEAQSELDQVNALNNQDVVDAYVNARAQDARNVSSPSTNRMDASAMRAQAKVRIADARYGLDKAQLDAANNVALAQCEGATNGAMKSCRDTAKAAHQSALTAAASRNSAAHQHDALDG